MPARRRDSLNRRTSSGTAVPALALLSIPSIKLLAIERMVSPAGGQAGYNHQFGWIVPGLEADLGYMGFNGGRLSPPQFDPQQQTHAVSSGGLFGTVTGRLGIAVDRALLYVKGGFAYANFRLGVTDSVPPLTTDATERLTYTGWTIGGGVEFALTQNWLIKTEYQFMDFGRKSISAVASDGITDTWKHDPSAHLIRLGLNYKF